MLLEQVFDFFSNISQRSSTLYRTLTRTWVSPEPDFNMRSPTSLSTLSQCRYESNGINEGLHADILQKEAEEMEIHYQSFGI